MKVEFIGDAENYLKVIYKIVIEQKEEQIKKAKFLHSKQGIMFTYTVSAVIILIGMAFLFNNTSHEPTKMYSYLLGVIALIPLIGTAVTIISFIIKQNQKKALVNQMKQHLENGTFLNSLDWNVKVNEFNVEPDGFCALDRYFVDHKEFINKLSLLQTHTVKEFKILPNSNVCATYVEEDGTIKDVILDRLTLLRNDNFKGHRFEIKDGSVFFYTYC